MKTAKIPRTFCFTEAQIITHVAANVKKAIITILADQDKWESLDDIGIACGEALIATLILDQDQFARGIKPVPSYQIMWDDCVEIEGETKSWLISNRN